MGDLLEAARAELARRQQAQTPDIAVAAQQELASRRAGVTVIATTDNGGSIYETADGTRGYFDDSYSTTDPERVAKLMEGATANEIVQSGVDRARIEQNPIAARANEFVRGTPFIGSYADEAVGVFSPQAGENMRRTTEAMRREHPGQTMALNVGGALATSIPAAVAAGPSLMANAGNTIGQRAVQGGLLGTAVGAIEGAVYGAGEGQGADRAKNASLGGAVGAGLGGVLGTVAPYAAAGTRALLGRLRGSDVQRIGAELQIGPQAAAVVRQALDAGDEDAAMAALQRGGDSAMLADANPNTQRLLDTAAQSPGAAGELARGAVNQRTQQASRQMVASLDDILGPARGEREIVSEIAQQSAPSRSAAYDAAYSAAIDYSTPQARQIESLLGRVPESAIRRANELMRIRGETSAQIIARVGDDGKAVFETLPDVRQLDYITRALNDVASEADGAGKLGGQTDLGMSIQALSRNIRGNLRAAVPEYGQALETAADAIGQRNGVETGYNLLRTGTRREDIGRALNGATGAEREAMRQGVRSFIDDTTANVTRTITDGDVASREGIQILRAMSSRANQTKLRMLLGRADADRLLGEIDEAATAFELRSAIAANSATYARSAMDGAVSEQTAPGMLRTLAQGDPINAGKRMIQALTGETPEAVTLRQQGLYQEIAEALVNTRGPEARQALQFVTQAVQGQRLNEQQARAISTSLVSGGFGGLVPVANREMSPAR